MEDISKYNKPQPLELREMLQKFPGWRIVKGRLEKQFRFENFARTMVFVNKIINPIEEHQNYPRILITYDRVLVSLYTNAAGGITLMDLEMAKEMDALGGDPYDPEKGMISV